MVFSLKNKIRRKGVKTKGLNPTAIGTQPLIGWNQKRRKTHLEKNTSTLSVPLNNLSLSNKCQQLFITKLITKMITVTARGLWLIISNIGAGVQSDYYRLIGVLVKRASEREALSEQRGRRLKSMREELQLHCMPVSLSTGIMDIESLENGHRIISQQEYHKLISYYRRMNKKRIL
jgi:hypothetical protein